MCKKHSEKTDGCPWILGNMDLAIVKSADKEHVKVILRMPQVCGAVISLTLQDQHSYEAGAVGRQTGLKAQRVQLVRVCGITETVELQVEY